MGWVLIGLLYLIYGADVVVTAITAAGLADELGHPGKDRGQHP